MILRRLAILTGSAAIALGLLAVPRGVAAQDECVGTKPRGGRAVSSAELYHDRARRAGDREAKARLHAAALKELEHDMEKNADNPNPRVYLWAGRVYAEQGRYVQADSAWTTASHLWSCYEAKIDTLRYNAWVSVFNRAVAYTENEEIDKALQAYRDAWTLYKKNPQPLLQLGANYAKEALAIQDDEARRSALQDSAIAYYERAIEAIERTDRLTEAERTETWRAASFNLAQLLAMEERFEEAAAAYEAFLANEPGNVEATSNAAVVLTRAARKYRTEAAEMEPGPEREAILARADSLSRLAINHYTNLIAREDLDAADYHNIGLGLAQIGLNEEATAAFEKALDLEPYRANSLQQLGLALFRAQRFDSLVVVAGALVDRYPLSMNNLAMLANAYRETQQLDSALAVLQRREAAELDFINVRLQRGEGIYTVTGRLINMKLDAGTPVELEFNFYDDVGEVVTSETVTLEAPDRGTFAPVTVSVESPALISGFTYRRVEA